MNFNLTPTGLIDQLRAWFHPKDRSVILADSCFIEGQEITKPGNPVSGRRRLYAKSGCWYDLGSNGTETGLCVSGIDPAGHTHSKLVASDGAPDPALSADASGYLSAAVQPLFSAYISATISNVTGDGTSYTVIYDTEIVDRNSNYNNATGVFTAPVSGYYLLIGSIGLQDIAVGHTTGYLILNTSNRNYILDYQNPATIAAAGYLNMGNSRIVDMDAGDTASVAVSISGGAKTVDIFKGVADWASFQGYLLM